MNIHRFLAFFILSFVAPNWLVTSISEVQNVFSTEAFASEQIKRPSEIQITDISIQQCSKFSQKIVHGEAMDADAFIRVIDLYSKTIGGYERVDIATDSEGRSSQSDRNAVARIIDTTLKFQTAYFHYPSRKRAEDLKGILDRLFATGFLSKLNKEDDDPRYVFGHFLAIALHSFDVLRARGMLTEQEAEGYAAELKKRFNLLAKAGKRTWFYMKHCEPGVWKEQQNCANHTYYEHYLRTLYGYIFKDPEHFLAGEEMFKFALDDAKADIGLWREASRGYWSWAYYSIGLTDLAAIAEIYRREGIDLYSYRSDISGLAYSDLVASFVAAIEDPEKMYKYAKKNFGLVGRERDLRDKTHYDRLLGSSFPERSNWYFLYKRRFPNDRAILDYETKADGLNNLARFHWNLGFNPQCNYAEAAITNSIQTESDITALSLKEQKPSNPDWASEVIPIDFDGVEVDFYGLADFDDFLKFKGSITDKEGSQFGSNKLNFGLMFDFKSLGTKQRNKVENYKIAVTAEDLSSVTDINVLRECKKTTYWEDDGQIKEINIQMKHTKDNECLFKQLPTETTQILQRLTVNMKSIIQQARFKDQDWNARIIALTTAFH
jgi:hypothetical protein